MDEPVPALVLAITGSWLAARIALRLFGAARKHYVAAADPRYRSLQNSLNASCWASAFVAVVVVFVQPALATLAGLPPAGWATLIAGLLGVAGIMLQPFDRLGAWLGTRPPARELSGFPAMESRVTASARSDRGTLLVVAPFFMAAMWLIVFQSGASSGPTILSYVNGFLLGLIHTSAAMNAVITRRALGLIQRELSASRPVVCVDQDLPGDGIDASDAIDAIDAIDLLDVI